LALSKTFLKQALWAQIFLKQKKMVLVFIFKTTNVPSTKIAPKLAGNSFVIQKSQDLKK